MAWEKIGIVGMIFTLLTATAFGVTIFVADDPVILYNSVGNYYYRLGNVERAMEMYHKALALDPDNAKAHYNLGVSLYSQGRHEGARLEFESAIREKGGYVQAHYSLGLLLFETGNLDGAVAELERAALLDGDNLNVHFDLAVVHVERFRENEKRGSLQVSDLENLRKGLEHYDAVLRLNPEFPDAQSNRDIVSMVLEGYEAQI